MFLCFPLSFAVNRNCPFYKNIKLFFIKKKVYKNIKLHLVANLFKEKAPLDTYTVLDRDRASRGIYGL